MSKEKVGFVTIMGDVKTKAGEDFYAKKQERKKGDSTACII